ncbi:MAG: hypothetical protein DCC65_03360 [Planctomycetota bacterium]|nr:MAG: hypothetical protein DCC65_03360 [Planctomycetota bacterium]
MTDYSIQTDAYSGPLDLLLYLIRREEIDLYDIPIARVTEQYCRYVETLATIDPNVAGDFLVMAATLMEIKSRMLLPRPPVEEGEAEDFSDPRLELVRQLLEYKKFKDASLELAGAADIQSQRWPRTPVRPASAGPGEIDLEDVQIWDLVAVFNKLMSSIGAGAATHDVVFDDTPIALHATDILDRLSGEGGEMGFEAIFTGRTRPEMVGLFLALLELMRQQRVRVVQEVVFGPIRVILLNAEPITVGSEWEPALREAVLGPQAQEASEPADSAAAAAPILTDDDLDNELLDDDLEGASYADLENIKTDVDIDTILKHGQKEEPEA